MWTFSLENESQAVPFCIGFEVCEPFLSRRNVELFFFPWQLCSSNFIFIYLFSFIFISWRLLTLQYLPYIDMNQPWIYMCSPSWPPLPPPSPSHKISYRKIDFFVFSFMNLNHCNNQDRYVASPSHLIFLCFVWRISARGTIWASAINFSNTQSLCETGLHFARARHDSVITWSCKSGLFLPSIYTKHSVGWNLGFSNHYSR